MGPIQEVAVTMVRFGDIRRQSHHKPQEAAPSLRRHSLLVALDIFGYLCTSSSSNTAVVALLVESSSGINLEEP
jgi:hypothetical protein